MDTLELIVDEGRLANAGRFFHLGVDLLDLLDELADLPVIWRVDDLRQASAVVRIAAPEPEGAYPQDDLGGRVLRLAYDSLARVRDGQGLPDGWNPDAVRLAHRFVEHGQPEDDERDWTPPRLRLVRDGEHVEGAVDLSPILGEQLAVLQPFERTMPGSVRGELVGLNISRGNRASLRLPNRRVVRVGFQSNLRAALKNELYNQVELRGLVKQDGDGRVFHIRADEVHRLVAPDVTWTTIHGSAPDYLGGVPIDEWLEVRRGEA